MSHLPPFAAALPVRPGDILAGKYRVDRILGAGGMGVVVAARNLSLGKPVAIKMMLAEMLAIPRAEERFEREARAAVQLKSEHVAEVLDIGKLGSGAPYIVMELLEGTDFEGIIQKHHPFPVNDAIDYVLQACEAVAEAHSLGVVHRDLKPRNLFLTHRLDGTPLVKVLDFGISKWTPADSDSHALTRTSDVIGSPNYMSPEQIRSAKDVDARTDIWSLGVILFELLTGRVPFLAESLPQLCALVLEQEAPLVSTLRPDVPTALVAIVARCLAKRVELRFQSVAELGAALEPLVPLRGHRGSMRFRLAASERTSRPSGPAPAVSSDSSGSGPAAPAVRVYVESRPSSSWARTILGGAGARLRRRLLGVAVTTVAVMVIALAVGVGTWRARASRDERPAAVGSSAPSTSPVSVPPALSSATLTESVPSAGAHAAPSTLGSLPTRPVRALDARAPMATATAVPSGSPSAASPRTTNPPPPHDDPFTPSDRK